MSAFDPSDRAVGAQAAPPPAPAEATDPRERPIGELLKDLADQTTTLVQQEIDLAKSALTLKGKQAGRGAGLLAGAAVVALLALGALTALLIIVLDEFLPLWAAALIVTVLWALVALVLANAGRAALKQATPPAPQTVETV